MLKLQGQTGLEAKFLINFIHQAVDTNSSIWPRRGLGAASVLLIWPRKMCYPMQTNIGRIHFVVVSLQVSLSISRGSM